jgi:hypothetical protein
MKIASFPAARSANKGGISMSSKDKLTRIAILLLAVGGAVSTSACAPLAAGAVGAAIGHEAAEERDEDDGDRD